MHFIVGIDLGTTNCAVAYIALEDLSRWPLPIRSFEIPQLTRPGFVEAAPLLPSFIYLPAENELPDGACALPWDSQRKLIVGELARSLGARTPGRLVASAKSWLCNPGVDRTAPILPWGALEDVARVSPVAASAAYLAHIREAWDFVIAKDDPARRLAEQDIVITVPASFDEAARELTVSAARDAGLPRLTLLEEPQAAFYAWMSAHAAALEADLRGINRVLVCDVGGGTTDFSLIEVIRTGKPSEPVSVRRTAVGDHLMLGGDNMDLTLARHVERSFSAPLDAHQFKALTASARAAKERLFEESPPEKVPLTVMGRGSKVIGGSLRTELTRADAASCLVDGFFPISLLEQNPVTSGRVGLREWGLPYVQDPAITRHLSQFLRHHAGTLEDGSPAVPRPDAVLFNGGAMKPVAFRGRILDVLKHWFGGAPVELAGTSLDLAVAIGAAAYGAVRRGTGMRIGGGLGRAYYVGIETDASPGRAGGKAAVCLVPQGTEEGQTLQLPQTFILRVATPVAFSLYSSSQRGADKLGTVIAGDSNDLIALPSLETTLQTGRRAVKRDVSVRLHVTVTEIGTLSLALHSIDDDRAWEVHLNVRSRIRDAGDSEAPRDAGTGADPRATDAALALIARAFDPQAGEPLVPGLLTKQLEAALSMSKDSWPAALARRMADALLDLAPQRARSAEHETRWLNLTGYLLRPGYGDLADAERLRKLYNATRNSLHFVSEPNARIEWWVLWRRLSAGLKADHEREMFNRLQPFLTGERDVTKRGGWPRPSKGELPEMWRTAASFELLDTPHKKLLGQRLIEVLAAEGPSGPLLWSLARLGARVPAYASANHAVPPALAESWLAFLFKLDWKANPMAVFAAVSLARKTGDRARDIQEALRGKTLDLLKRVGASEHDLDAVRKITDIESADRKLIFGEAPPPALRIENAGG